MDINMDQFIIVCFVNLLLLTLEGVNSNEYTLLSPSGCQWSWSPWTDCDPGPCDNPRNKRDRLKIITQAPLKRMNESCPFYVANAISANYPTSDSYYDSDIIQTVSCTTGEPCYWSNTTCYSPSKEMFLCPSGECIPKTFVSNGDRDCGDGSDEYTMQKKNLPCPEDLEGNIGPLPNSYVWSNGRNLLFKKLGESVLSEGFHGTCDIISDSLYRKQYNVEDVVPLVDDTEVRSVSSFSNWVTFAKHLQKMLKVSQTFTDVYNALEDLENVTFHEGVTVTLSHRLKLKEPKLLQLKPQFTKRIQSLPKTYSYQKYFEFFEDFGTHYFEEATLGGAVRVYFAFDANRFETKDIEQSLYNFLGYLSGNITLRGTYDILRKSRIVRFVVTGGKTQYSDLNKLTLRLFNRGLYSEWYDSLKFFPEVIDVEMFNSSGTFDSHLSNVYLPLSRLLEGDHVVLDKKISVWENMERALQDYQQPYLNEGSLCSACPQPEKAYIVPDIQETMGIQNEKQYGCVCATKDGRPPIIVATVKPESQWTRIAKLVMIGIGSLLGVVVLFIVLDWCLGWKIIRCECRNQNRNSHEPYDDTTERETLSTNGKPPTTASNGRLNSMLAEPEIHLTEIDESGIEHDMSSGRLVQYPDLTYT